MKKEKMILNIKIKQIIYLFIESLKLIKKYKPDNDNIFELTNLKMPFDFVFTFNEKAPFNALYRRNYKENQSLIIINCKKFPNAYKQNKFDYIFEKMKSIIIIHEIIHYLDIEVRNIPVDPTEVNKNSFNHPIEFNAYFQQISSYWYNILQNIIKSKSPLDDFNIKIGNNVRDFSDKFWKNVKNNSKMYDLINKDNIFRWNKRIYDLYFNLKDDLFNKISNDDVKNDIKLIQEKLKQKIKGKLI